MKLLLRSSNMISSVRCRTPVSFCSFIRQVTNSWYHFVCSVGVLPNSILYGANERKYFVNADPRFRRLLAQVGLQGEESSASDAPPVFQVPSSLRTVKSYRGKQRMVTFDYSVHNVTKHILLTLGRQP
jgi:hypothetical protein